MEREEEEKLEEDKNINIRRKRGIGEDGGRCGIRRQKGRGRERGGREENK